MYAFLQGVTPGFALGSPVFAVKYNSRHHTQCRVAAKQSDKLGTRNTGRLIADNKQSWPITLHPFKRFGAIGNHSNIISLRPKAASEKSDNVFVVLHDKNTLWVLTLGACIPNNHQQFLRIKRLTEPVAFLQFVSREGTRQPILRKCVKNNHRQISEIGIPAQFADEL